MGRRLNRTVKNWRWWALYPLFILLIPIMLADLALAAIETTGREIASLRRWGARKLSPILNTIQKWETKGVKP